MDAGAVYRILAPIAPYFGLVHFTVMEIPRPKAAIVPALVHCTTLPRSFVEIHDHVGLLRFVPLTETHRRPGAPLQWSLADIENPDDPGRSDFAQRMRALQITMGIVFTFAFDANRQTGLLFFGDRKPLGSKEEFALTRIARRALRRHAELHNHPGRPIGNLSARETEVIRWTAEGKTSHEIGGILGLSDHTVNAYLANAIRKMDCVNRAQLVAKAIRFNIID
ncbi:helix-turn-helix transcriptional regulator [Martelella radicis]|uniref:DNA-binding CsgD family transcriptional regulator n=1 Tax=Martelella radicis TaxID=1397476 RepID=A0A7W6KHC5_9HYPH|nr:LuxR C-terminal-related transcriptional regulator [Martelella radicis]MBB4121334.1 DNA-binding CsgD family transcriptional regulator [Martelella radicis]